MGNLDPYIKVLEAMVERHDEEVHSRVRRTGDYQHWQLEVERYLVTGNDGKMTLLTNDRHQPKELFDSAHVDEILDAIEAQF